MGRHQLRESQIGQLRDLRGEGLTEPPLPKGVLEFLARLEERRIAEALIRTEWATGFRFKAVVPRRT